MGFAEDMIKGHEEAAKLAEFYGVTLARVLYVRAFNEGAYKHLLETYNDYQKAGIRPVYTPKPYQKATPAERLSALVIGYCCLACGDWQVAAHDIYMQLVDEDRLDEDEVAAWEKRFLEAGGTIPAIIDIYEGQQVH